MSFSLAFLILSPQRLCSSKDFEVLKVHTHKFMLLSFATICYHRSKKSVSSKMHHSSSTVAARCRLRKVIFLSFPHSFSLVFDKSPHSRLDLPFGKHPFCYYPVYFPLEIEVMCKQFVVEHVVEGETVSRRLCKDYLHQV